MNDTLTGRPSALHGGLAESRCRQYVSPRHHGRLAETCRSHGGIGTLVGDLDPAGDVCSGKPTVQLGGLNVGDLLKQKGISWGSFMGGFDFTITNPSPAVVPVVPKSPARRNGGPTADYIPHHAFFQYWPAARIRPTPVQWFAEPVRYSRGHRGEHELWTPMTFSDALNADNLPAVSFSRRRPIWTARGLLRSAAGRSS